jgi:hypothetical protein
MLYMYLIHNLFNIYIYLMCIVNLFSFNFVIIYCFELICAYSQFFFFFTWYKHSSFLHQTRLKVIYGSTVSIDSYCWSTEANVGGAILGLVVLGCLRKQTQEAMRNKTVSRTSPWTLLQFLPTGFCLSLTSLSN